MIADPVSLEGAVAQAGLDRGQPVFEQERLDRELGGLDIEPALEGSLGLVESRERFLLGPVAALGFLPPALTGKRDIQHEGPRVAPLVDGASPAHDASP